MSWSTAIEADSIAVSSIDEYSRVCIRRVSSAVSDSRNASCGKVSHADRQAANKTTVNCDVVREFMDT
jgi:hypothetical protein